MHFDTKLIAGRGNCHLTIRSCQQFLSSLGWQKWRVEMWFWHLDRITYRIGPYFLFMGSFHVLWADKAFPNEMACLGSPHFLGGEMCRCNLWLMQKSVTERKIGPWGCVWMISLVAWGCTWTYPDPALREGWGSLRRGQQWAVIGVRSERADHEKSFRVGLWKLRPSVLVVAVMATGSASGKCHNPPHTVGSPESHSEKQIATLGHRAMNKRWGNLLTHSVRRLPAWIPLGIQGEQSWSPLGRRTCWCCDLESKLQDSDTCVYLWMTGPGGHSRGTHFFESLILVLGKSWQQWNSYGLTWERKWI